eukprot:TRINITY_DN21223_c0_g1_i2.p1 TRINITY_DN21223_c0_g1~~TRINITY_DN21223_c0_g1_i2.p1  ORF type:complete len:170 (+),score=9.30 TRINITY_DN21223_c0_g1_i2:208-717(+)
MLRSESGDQSGALIVPSDKSLHAGDDGLLGGQHLPDAIAESDLVPISLAQPAHDNSVIILKELAFGPIAEGDWVGSLPRDLEHGAVRRPVRAGDGPGAEEVAGPHVAARHGVVAELLGHGVVQELGVGGGDVGVAPRGVGFDAAAQLDVVRLGPGLLEVRQQRRPRTLR